MTRALTLRATNTAPVTPLTHALMSLQRRVSEYDNMLPALSPVVEVVVNQGNHVRNYNPIPPKTLKELKEVVWANSPIHYFSTRKLNYFCSSSLADYEDLALEKAEQNRQNQIPISLDMPCGKGPFSGVKTEELSKIRQGPDEPFQDFVSQLLQAIGRQVQDTESGTLLVRQLAYENANPACQAAIWPWRKKGNLVDYIHLCADIGPAYQQGLAMAAAQAGMTVAAYAKQKFDNYNMDSPDLNVTDVEIWDIWQNNPVPQTNQQQPCECPRCHRGNHWANECHSKQDAQGNPLIYKLGNGQKGQSRPPHKFGAPILQESPQTTMANPNPFLSSFRQPQAAQDLTSVPPPDKS
ncbi:Gag polyprotein [Plecturocebus cupreus]